MMKIIDKLSECDDKLLDPRTLSFRLKNPIRRKINDLLSQVEEKEDESDDDAGSKLGVNLKKILDRDEDQKHLLSYDDVSDIHRTLQRLDPTYRLFFHELLDECRAFVTDERSVRTLRSSSVTDALSSLNFRSNYHSLSFPSLSPNQNKELGERLKKLQFDLGNKSYKEMTKAITDPRTGGRSPAALDVASEGTVLSVFEKKHDSGIIEPLLRPCPCLCSRIS